MKFGRKWKNWGGLGRTATVDVDEGIYVGDEQDGVYVGVGKGPKGWYVSTVVDSETGSFVDDLFVDDGPYATREEAVQAGINAGLEWCFDNGVECETPASLRGFGYRRWDNEGQYVTGTKVVSTTKLSKMLYEAGLWPRTFTTRDLGEGVSDETYGKKSMLYLRTKDMAHRKAIEDFFEKKNIKAFPRYSPGSPVVEVQVSYFKGWHWDE
jgi:hypothetical protein